ncbi:hypothetical protein BX659_13528 [Orenia metallireducens]|jgi:hypothetical protein|uniref:Outer membrane protein beta-barrel domain-containing protein n=1 Tax=Orenia metallireducens TaxID=1413210 RepID=A0A285IBB4_9FIRM|nr:hypothetical protein [Orenia metallireducens]PRX20628.1 hypothetical protein BX659_13528 [Orenia metallireducens]SNY45258.1 hypothetical protein SAMN06265827_13729 [Orenia metallireducens]
MKRVFIILLIVLFNSSLVFASDNLNSTDDSVFRQYNISQYNINFNKLNNYLRDNDFKSLGDMVIFRGSSLIDRYEDTNPANVRYAGFAFCGITDSKASNGQEAFFNLFGLGGIREQGIYIGDKTGVFFDLGFGGGRAYLRLDHKNNVDNFEDIVENPQSTTMSKYFVFAEPGITIKRKIKKDWVLSLSASYFCTYDLFGDDWHYGGGKVKGPLKNLTASSIGLGISHKF